MTELATQTAASWVSAIGSAGSLLGFASYVWIMLLNRQDEGEVRQEEHAQSVAAWLDEGARHGRDEQYVLCVHNGGVSPVFNCRLLFSLPNSEQRHSVDLAIVPPHATATRSLPYSFDNTGSEDMYSATAVPELRFTDSHGAHWQRDSNGELSRLQRRGPRRRPLLRERREERDDTQWQRDYE
ncbi:hypothetical protein FHX37_3228 [Haloactinospora alba]|uniref:Uncharacterized protein n=1 Tax=Haloactinospora alba TaxID=405555 RepID=A0A543NN28_9ACTN|nr:hypothetical protein [Haloactinospora alba]TQN33223.1 hypothetical protein FHX37_3228 [Haloactinospora alba]